MMRLFIFEYICGGGWPEQEFSFTLATEGATMLGAVVEDFLKLDDVEVWTTWDTRLGPFPFSLEHLSDKRLHVKIVHSSKSLDDLSASVLPRCDAALFIAPETAGILQSLCHQVERLAGVRSLNALPNAIQLCGDKYQLHRHLTRCGISMPEQWTWEERDQLFDQEPATRYVLKLRDGAGSQDMQLLSSHELQQLGTLGSEGSIDDKCWIIEKFIPGRAISVAAVFDDQGIPRTIFPPAEQQLTTDGHFVYLGGRVPADNVPLDKLHCLITKLGTLLPGLRGYIGFDVVLPSQAPELPCLIEINPRLTTSYAGYRKVTTDNLARWLMPWQVPEKPPSFNGSVSFSSSGKLTAWQELDDRRMRDTRLGSA